MRGRSLDFARDDGGGKLRRGPGEGTFAPLAMRRKLRRARGEGDFAVRGITEDGDRVRPLK